MAPGLWVWFFGTRLLFVFLQRGLKSSISTSLCPLQTCSRCSLSRSMLFISRLSCCLFSLSSRRPSRGGFVPFPPAPSSPSLQAAPAALGLAELRGRFGQPCQASPFQPQAALQEMHTPLLQPFVKVGWFLCCLKSSIYFSYFLIFIFSFFPPS